VVCCEHVGPRRAWTNDDESFVFILSGLLAVTLEQVA
jgi:hypothetical protein